MKTMDNVNEDVPDLQEDAQDDDSPTKKHKNNSEASQVVSEKIIKQSEEHDPNNDNKAPVDVPVSSSDAVGTSGKSYQILRTLLTSPHKPIEPIAKVTSPSQVSSQTEEGEETQAKAGRKTGKAEGRKKSPNKKTRDATKK